MDDLEIARLVEKSQIDATSALAKIWLPLGEGGAGFETEGSYMNRACGLGMHGPVDGADLDRLTAFFEERGAEAQVHASAYADDSLFAGLAARGFVLRHIEHLFAREIVAGDDFSATGPPEGVRVERVDVTDEPALHAYLAMSESGFSPDLAALGDAYQDTGVRAARLPNTDAFVARLEGRVVGAAGSTIWNGMAGLYGATVDPWQRGRGIQRALMAARLDAARRRGATLATTRTLPGVPTERNAVRLGFRLISARTILARPAPAPAPRRADPPPRSRPRNVARTIVKPRTGSGKDEARTVALRSQRPSPAMVPRPRDLGRDCTLSR